MGRPNDEALAGDTAQRSKDNTQDDTQIIGHGAGERKALATVTAQLAMRGFELHRMGDGSFLVTRWNLSRPLADLNAARRFAESVGAA